MSCGITLPSIRQSVMRESASPASVCYGRQSGGWQGTGRPHEKTSVDRPGSVRMILCYAAELAKWLSE